jgi:glycosyltransferase involved in cell wall biosynthesis
MKISVIIPTYQRKEKLGRCLRSLETQTYKDFSVHVFCDNNDTETYNYVKSITRQFPIYAYLNDKQEFVVGSWNKFFAMNLSWDVAMWCCDDVELYEDCLEKAVNKMKEFYSDTDGVIGLAQECPNNSSYTYQKYGQCLLGRKFTERYPNRQVCGKFYRHFYQDTEMFLFASSLKKFYFCEEAKLKHYHPAYIQKELDRTHHIVRQKTVKDADVAMFAERQKRNLIWGRTFDSVEEYDKKHAQNKAVSL